ncbi:MAG: DUF222 domain-containing protein [Candidatus Nanopelagicales bacterium]
MGGLVGTSTLDQPTVVVDERATEAALAGSTVVARMWALTTTVSRTELPGMGLAAGERPTADVELLAGALGAVEYELARRMHAATASGSLPLVGPGAVLAARGWAPGPARRLARAGAVAAAHPSIADVWALGLITAEHVDAVARHADAFTAAELAAVVAELAAHWGQWSPAAIARFVAAAARMLHPPPDPEPGEADAYESRDLSVALLGDSVLLSATLPRLEGEAVIAAIDAWAEKLRTTAEHTPAGTRRADALMQLVTTAAATGTLPTRGGLPVALTVTLDHTSTGDPIWATSRGHHLTHAEQRFTACDPTLTPIATTNPANKSPGHGDCEGNGGGGGDGGDGGGGDGGGGDCGDGSGGGGDGGGDVNTPTPAARIAALADLLLAGPRLPLAVGRTSRTATNAQRRALATRDGGCIIPGCRTPPETCQTHHLHQWATGGQSDLPNLVLLCWTHHRQVDLNMWSITPTTPKHQTPTPHPNAPPATPWPANNRSPWTITRQPRTRWRL